MYSLTDNEDPNEPNYAELHVIVVEENVGKMRSEKGVNSAAGADEIDFRIEYRRSQGTWSPKREDIKSLW